MCLTCGCMDAHKEMGEANLTYEDLEAAADENHKGVEETVDVMTRTLEVDRAHHPSEYATTARVS